MHVLRVVVLAILVGCPVTEPATEPVTEPFTELPDCSVCGDNELCWYSYDFDGTLEPVRCVSWPSECDEDRTCDCLDELVDTEIQESDDLHPCSILGLPVRECEVVDGRPAQECLTTLG